MTAEVRDPSASARGTAGASENLGDTEWKLESSDGLESPGRKVDASGRRSELGQS